MHFSCSSDDCSAAIRTSIFTKNFAEESGGALYYDSKRISIETSSVDFTDNTSRSKYGNNIGSYPYSLELVGAAMPSTITIHSGEVSKTIYSLALKDQDGQIVNNFLGGYVRLTMQTADVAIHG